MALLRLCLPCLGLMLAASACLAGAPDDQPVPDLPPVDESMPAEDPAGSDRPQSQPWGLESQWWGQHIVDRTRSVPLREVGTDVLRFALDLRKQWELGERLRWGWSSRLDLVEVLHREAGAPEHGQDLHSLREAWLSWRHDAGERVSFIDAGRINWRLGAGGGFNPTDFFKTGAARAVSNADPRATRLDRLGVVMLRGQIVTPSGSWTAALAPRLTDRTTIDERVFALALERTNRSAATLLKWSPQWRQSVSLDGSLFIREGEKPQAGLNFSWLPASSLVLHAEWAGGKRSPLAPVGEPARPLVWRNRLAAGATWTSPQGWELLVEYQRAGDALSRADWQQWREVDAVAPLRELGAMSQRRAYEREPLVRSGWFARASWRQAFDLRSLNLHAFVQANAYDDSRLWQLRGDWRLNPRWSLVGMAGSAQGAPNSEFGSYNPRSHVSLYLAYFH